VNEANAYTTDTMHRVVPHERIDVNALVASYYNSLSFASAEVCGRSHGGGVLELMPNEAEQVIVPYRQENAALLPRIDAALRDEIPISEILQFTNKQILSSGQGLSDSQIELSTRVWQRLMGRRLARHHA
jgi:adenine-specific DNA-methyltransferase